VRRAERPWLIAAAALLLAACATAPKEARFYREDGPPDRIPPDLLATPDPVPRDEPLNPFANRPYAALGRTYVPDTSDAPFHQRGLASWYGRQFQGNRTASGERYDMFAMTAAHPTLPIPSYARVTNLRDGRSVIVRINDRGPFLKDRIIDLSYVAAARLGLAAPGSGEVEVDRLLPAQVAHATPPARTPEAIVAPVMAAGGARGGAQPILEADPPAFRASGCCSSQDATPLAAGVHGPGPGVGAGPHWSVQLGAFSVPTNAEALRERLALLLSSPEASALPAELRVPRIETDAGLSRVLIGEAAQRTVALQWSRLLEQYLSRPTALFLR
jgi:rare lipoprotein A